MKPFWRDLLFSCIMGMIIPWMILSVGVAVFGGESALPEPTVAQIRQESSQTIIPVLTDEGIYEMELDTYLTGVVLAEMPASFETEAHKAQAVVARTYTMRGNDGRSKHEDAAVCTDSACCQGYISEEDYLLKGGTAEQIDKVRSAVLSTEGLVLTYEGELIEATYFSCSGGVTEDAVAVWGTDVPYLQSVESPGEEAATYYTDTKTFCADEFRAALFKDLAGEPGTWFGDVTYTAGGGVETMVICGREYRGTELRSMLGLRSTAFTVSTEGDFITVSTRGFGHRVGMSQYGADAMAAAGSDFREILAHYYQGTVLKRFD